MSKANIPNGWKIEKLGNLLLKIVGGGTPSRDRPEYYNGKIPWATVKDLSDDNYKSDTIEYISEQGLKNSSAKIIKKGNFIISTRMGIGRGFINLVDMAINQDLKGLYPDKDKLDVVYLMYWYKKQKKKLELLSSGSTVKGIDLKLLKSLKIYVMPLEEQRKIAAILSTWDKAIELKEKLIEQKKEQKKGLMQKLLTGEVRLPGFNGEWIEVKLGDLGECIRGVSYNPKDLYLNDNQNSIRLLRSNNIQDGTLNNDDIQYVDKSIVKEKQLLRKNDLVISMANGSKKLVGKNGVFHSLSNFEYTVGAFCAIFRFNNKCSPNYAKYLFQTNKYEYFVQNLIAGSNINNLKPSDIESMKFIVPANRNEQEEIAKVIDQITNEIKLLGKEILLLKQQKKGLMQLLLTGKVRVKV